MTKLVCYSLKATPSKRTMLHKELYGYKDYSNKGKYYYERIGVIHTTKAKKICDAVILISDIHFKKLTSVLQKYGARIYSFDVKSKIKL